MTYMSKLGIGKYIFLNKLRLGEQASRGTALIPSGRSVTSSQLHIGGGYQKKGTINDSESEFG
jgi:hypothetical protein